MIIIYDHHDRDMAPGRDRDIGPGRAGTWDWDGTGTVDATKTEDRDPLSSEQVGIQVFFADLAFCYTSHDVWS